MADNRASAMQFLLGKGLTRAQAAGVVGSLMQESGLSTTAKNKSSGALGIGQWLGGRKTALLNSGNSGSLGGQLDFLWSELQGPEKAALQRLKGAHSVEDAASAFTWGFERPGQAEANMANRVKQGRAALGLGSGGGSDGSDGSTSATTTTTVQTDPSASVVAALDALPLPERKKPKSTMPVQAPSFSSAPVTSGQALQTTTPEKKPTALEALKKLDIREPAMTTTTTETATAGTDGASDSGTGTKGSKVLELIFNDGGKGYGIKNGAVVNGSQVFSEVWGGHADHVHVAAGPKTVVRLGKLAEDMGLHVGENPHFGGEDPSKHVEGSYHNKGQAIDVSGDPSKMAAFAKRVERYNRTRAL
jgi:Phage tail lysozyme